VRTTKTTDWTGIVTHQSGGFPYLQAMIFSGYFLVNIGVGANTKSYYGSTYISDNRWHHVAFSYDGTNDQLKLFVDGKLQTPTKLIDQNVSTFSCTQYLLIGAERTNNPNLYFSGRIDEVRVWNTARTEQQLKDNMKNVVSPTSTGLVAYYKFDETSGTTLLDQTSNANNGTLTNGPTWVESYAMVIPTATEASNAVGTSFTANWTVPTVGTVYNYYIDVATDSTFTAPITGSPFSAYTPATSKVISGQMGVTYYYRVRANNGGSVSGQGGYSNTIAVTIGVPTTQLSTSFCGATVTNKATNLYCDMVSGATEYEFEVTNTQLGISSLIKNPTPSNARIQLGYIPAVQYGYTYGVRVRALVGGQWGSWGTFCNVTLSAGTTQLTSTYCAYTTSNKSTDLYCDIVNGATEYEFEVTNTQLGISSLIKNPTPSKSRFQLAYVPGVQYGYTYGVRVRALVSGQWTSWGTPCNVTLSVGGTQLTPTYCGTVITNKYVNLYCNIVNGATEYQFEVTNSPLGISALVQNPIPSKMRIQLGYVSAVQYGYTYSIRVRALVNGQWSSWGPSCNVTLNNPAKSMDNDTETGILTDLLLYPNPVKDNVNIELSTEENGEYQIEIYDITGRKVDSEEGFAEGVITITKNISHYNSGIYLVKAQFGQDVFVKRIIKE
jgi:hypothetical protein